jgi:rhodanese-related sulfurtransferase
MRTISVPEARKLIQQGAVLIDVREADEHARERIPGARSAPLSKGVPPVCNDVAVVFHCRSGNRTAASAHLLRDAAAGAACEGFLLEGGLEAWKAAGLAVEADRKAPLELMRQVQIAAGGLALVGFVLGMTVDPAWHAVSGLVGAGLLFAGASGWCGLAKVLAVMPWNRAAA